MRFVRGELAEMGAPFMVWFFGGADGLLTNDQ